MTIYTYDGTFEGFLTALATAWERGEKPVEITRTPLLQRGLFSELVDIETAPERALGFFDDIAVKISPFACRTLYHAFLSDAAGMEMDLFRYLELGWRVGRRFDSLLTREEVLPVHRLARKVVHETHRMKGFVRFKQTREGFYYAQLEPDHRILPLIAPHFSERFSDQNWIIHDIRRGEAIIHDAARKKWVPVEMDLCGTPEFTAKERLCQELWKRYFDRIAIEERKNPRLQGSKLPLKYRKHLVEV
ncbi:MAG: hypothetical protein FD174_1892 [Geobacteraceae bacterium]|nr:MAG: hypothetical protein FD174_1892 [Geobacteraceae bacterium]